MEDPGHRMGRQKPATGLAKKVRQMQQDGTRSEQADTPALTAGTRLLRGQYQIEAPLTQGGFGITYLARDSLDRRVVIKECFPASICQRSQGRVRPRERGKRRQYLGLLRHFLHEARRLARLDHISIVGVHQVFEENNTAYMALDYVEGVDLMTVLETPERLTPARVTRLLEQALSALRYIHGQGILHRDISPDNFLLGPDDRVTLIDFGAAREEARRGRRPVTALLTVKEGYSPQEFYRCDAAENQASDIYSLGATFHHLIAGSAPPSSTDRLAALGRGEHDPYHSLLGRFEGYDPALLASIDAALAPQVAERIQSARDWQKRLGGARASSVLASATVALSADLSELGPLSPGQAAAYGDLRDRIQDLVAKTNRCIDTAPVQSTAAYCEPETDQPLAEAQVDLFGTPIANVPEWLAEQDQDVTALPAVAIEISQVPQMAPDAAPVGPVPAKARSSRGFLGLGRLFSGRGSSRAALQG